MQDLHLLLSEEHQVLDIRHLLDSLVLSMEESYCCSQVYQHILTVFNTDVRFLNILFGIEKHFLTKESSKRTFIVTKTFQSVFKFIKKLVGLN